MVLLRRQHPNPSKQKATRRRRLVRLGCVLLCVMTIVVHNALLWLVAYVERTALVTVPVEEEAVQSLALYVSHRARVGWDLHQNDERSRRHVWEEQWTTVSSSSSSPDSSSSSRPPPPSASACWSLNSESWLTGPRHGNDRDSNFTVQDMTQQILGSATVLASTDLMKQWLGQTLCHGNSRFVNGVDNDPHANNNQERDIRIWAARLVYLLIHYHQHQHAIPEAQARRLVIPVVRPATTTPAAAAAPAAASTVNTDASAHGTNTNDGVTCAEQLVTQYDVGQFDYECPQAKYLVMSLSESGLGSNVRVGTAVALSMGLALNRVVLIVNHCPVQVLPDLLRLPWDLASCHRRDYQCSFLPISPCVLTYQDLESAYALSDEETERLFEDQYLPPGHERDKVIILSWLHWLPKRAITLSQIALYAYSTRLLEALPADDPRLPLLQQAADSLLREDNVRPGYDFPGATSRILHALEFYSIRPNPRTAARVDEILRVITPPLWTPPTQSPDDPGAGVLGLPIRGSDKCALESDCLDFTKQLEMISYFWDQHLTASTTIRPTATGAHQDPSSSGPRPLVTVILTTESQDILDEQQRFLANDTWQSQYKYQFRFVTNPLDVLPGTGMLAESEGINPDEAMISSLSTFKLQLLATVTVGNCCSNYHQLLSDYFMEGCGGGGGATQGHHHTYYCVQDYNHSAHDPSMMVCCWFDKECHVRKIVYLAEVAAAAAGKGLMTPN